MLFKPLTIILLQSMFVYGQEVETKYGKVKGLQQELKDGTPLYVFLGIPYAKQPLEDLRFKDPVPLTQLNPGGVIEATKPTRCVQFLTSIQKVIGQEDCLHLNIYTTALDNKANHDVLVFIHGGVFSYGAGHSHTPEYLYEKNKNLVFVSINYRLGPFGFLSTGDSVVPGNMGLKDQVLALEWINSNIQNFGGNPENIVLAGMSAGGISVHLHYLSPLSRNLFSKGISMSGSALSHTVKDKYTREGYEYLIKLFPDCDKGESSLSVKCLAEIPAMKLMATIAAHKHPWQEYIPYIFFRPVIENGSPNPFLDEHPFHLLRKGNVKHAPWLTSATTAEGLLPVAMFVESTEKMRVLDQNWKEIAPYLLIFKDLVRHEEDLPKVSELVRKYYLGDKPIAFESYKEIVKLVGDRLFMTSIENAVRLHATASKEKVYMYLFDYRGESSFSTVLSRSHSDLNLGACHSDDLFYILTTVKMVPKSDKDLQISDIMVNIWISFIKTGNPDTGTGIEWPAVSESVTYDGNIDYVLIDHDSPKAISKSDLSERVFWDTLPLEELHITGDLKVPRYIKELEKGNWLPSQDTKMSVIKARLQRTNPLAYFLKKKYFKTIESKKLTLT